MLRFCYLSALKGFFMRKVALLGIVIAILISGCVSDQAHRIYISENSYQPKNPESVEILYKKPSKEFTVIADLQARGKALEEFRAIGGKIGADAIIISYLGGNIVSAEFAGKDEGKTYNRIAGTAIKYKEDK
jgi:hypothetical protein